MVALMMRRLGLKGDKGVAMMNALLKAARETKCGFDEMFFDLYGGVMPDKALYQSEAFAPYLAVLKEMRADEHIGRNHAYFEANKAASLVIDEVEGLWAPIAASDDWSAFEAKVAHIRLYGAALARYER